MNHIQNFYKNKCENLTEQINYLKNQFRFLKEDDTGDTIAIAQTNNNASGEARNPRPLTGDALMYGTSLYNPADGYWNTSNGKAFMSGWSYLARYYNIPSAWGRPGSPPYMASPATFEAYMRGQLPQGVYPPPFRR
jgi:hypothetical protein